MGKKFGLLAFGKGLLLKQKQNFNKGTVTLYIWNKNKIPLSYHSMSNKCLTLKRVIMALEETVF